MTLARLRAPLLGLMLCVGGRSVKRWQQIEKRLKRKASEHLKHRWLGGNPGKCQHLVSPLLLDQDRYHTIAALFPIKSIDAFARVSGGPHSFLCRLGGTMVLQLL